jgi:hypothetical protein
MKTTTLEKPAFPHAHSLANGLSARFRKDYKPKFSTSHRKKKNGFYAEYSALFADAETQEMHAPVVLRIYYPGNVCYSCIWISNYHPGFQSDYISTRGSGTAGGGGYHKQSAAAQAAINNAGFELSLPIDGRGEGMMRDAVLAIADAIGFSGARVHVSHA